MSKARDIADRGSSIDSSEITDGAVTSSKLASGAAATNIGTGGVTSSMLAEGAVEGAMVTPSGRRNLVINGAMQVDQRYSGTAWTNWNGYSADRWHKRTAGNAVCSIQTVTDAPDGFKNSYKSSITTGFSGTHLNVGTALEGQDIVSLAAGTSSAKNVTLSFWVKASIVGTYCVAFQNPTTMSSYDSTLSYISEYSISSVNTWEYKTITIPMATTGTWNASNGIGLVVRFSYGKDGTYSGTANSWVSGHKTNTTSQTDLAATTGATFQITGVQLEVGSVATPFEHRSYGEELALCQRYFERKLYNANGYITTMANWNDVSHYGGIGFEVTKRANPSMSTSAVANFRLYGSGVYVNPTSINFNAASVNNVEMYANTTSKTPSANWLRTNATGSYIDIDAEL